VDGKSNSQARGGKGPSIALYEAPTRCGRSHLMRPFTGEGQTKLFNRCQASARNRRGTPWERQVVRNSSRVGGSLRLRAAATAHNTQANGFAHRLGKGAGKPHSLALGSDVCPVRLESANDQRSRGGPQIKLRGDDCDGHLPDQVLSCLLRQSGEPLLHPLRKAGGKEAKPGELRATLIREGRATGWRGGCPIPAG
jgi:hypothetical protein